MVAWRKLRNLEVASWWYARSAFWNRYSTGNIKAQFFCGTKWEQKDSANEISKCRGGGVGVIAEFEISITQLIQSHKILFLWRTKGHKTIVYWRGRHIPGSTKKKPYISLNMKSQHFVFAAHKTPQNYSIFNILKCSGVHPL